MPGPCTKTQLGSKNKSPAARHHVGKAVRRPETIAITPEVKSQALGLRSISLGGNAQSFIRRGPRQAVEVMWSRIRFFS
jgi:hypothetical protein